MIPFCLLHPSILLFFFISGILQSLQCKFQVNRSSLKSTVKVIPARAFLDEREGLQRVLARTRVLRSTPWKLAAARSVVCLYFPSFPALRALGRRARNDDVSYGCRAHRVPDEEDLQGFGPRVSRCPSCAYRHDLCSVLTSRGHAIFP